MRRTSMDSLLKIIAALVIASFLVGAVNPIADIKCEAHASAALLADSPDTRIYLGSGDNVTPDRCLSDNVDFTPIHSEPALSLHQRHLQASKHPLPIFLQHQSLLL